MTFEIGHSQRTRVGKNTDLQMHVGICGVEGAGKTVFLTALFQTLSELCQGRPYTASFCTDTGGAAYFDEIQHSIAATGSTRGTRDITRARLVLTPRPGSGWNVGETLHVNLMDFGGGDFRRLADPNVIRKGGGGAEQAETQQRLQTVREFIDRCDAVILLVNASDFLQGTAVDSAPKWIIGMCREAGKPLAFVLSQRDRAGQVTAEQVRADPMIANVHSNLSNSVHLITCYTLDPSSGRPRRSLVGFWTGEAVDVFQLLVEKALPGYRIRIHGIKTTIISEDALRIRKEEAERRRRMLRKALAWGAAAGVTAVLVLVAFLIWTHVQRKRVAANDEWARGFASRIASGEPVTPADSERFARMTQSAEDLSPGIPRMVWYAFLDTVGKELDSDSSLVETRDDRIQVLKSWADFFGKMRGQLAAVGDDDPSEVDRREQGLSRRIELLLFFKTQETRIRGAADLTGQLAAIREAARVLAENRFSTEPRYALAGRKFLAHRMVLALLERTRTGRTESDRMFGLFGDLAPQLSLPEGVSLQFQRIVRFFQTDPLFGQVADSPGTYNFDAGWQRALEACRTERTLAVGQAQSVRALFDGIVADPKGPEEEKALLETVQAAAKGVDLFTPDYSARLYQGAVPARFRLAGCRSLRTARNLLMEPYYAAERETLVHTLANRAFRYAVIRNFVPVVRQASFSASAWQAALGRVQAAWERYYTADVHSAGDAKAFESDLSVWKNWVKGCLTLYGASLENRYKGIRRLFRKSVLYYCTHLNRPNIPECALCDSLVVE